MRKETEREQPKEPAEVSRVQELSYNHAIGLDGLESSAKRRRAEDVIGMLSQGTQELDEESMRMVAADPG